VNKLLDLALEASQLAGAKILECYDAPSSVELKFDGSPLTNADKIAHEVILNCLIRSGFPIISEEGDDLKLITEQYWLVDPLDGTKDFLVGNDEFTVNIAFIDKARPVLGVVFAPAIGDMYWGGKGIGVWRAKNGVKISLNSHHQSRTCRMAVSRFHDHPDVDSFALDNGITYRVAIGSALKYCLLAAAEVDVYPRFVGCSEWDTAAGQAILEAAGGALIDWRTGVALKYGKLGRRNPRLLAFRSPYSKESFKLQNYKSELL
jgi:3'(2'), 5'-bisphosphate nucleotidase